MCLDHVNGVNSPLFKFNFRFPEVAVIRVAGKKELRITKEVRSVLFGKGDSFRDYDPNCFPIIKGKECVKFADPYFIECALFGKASRDIGLGE